MRKNAIKKAAALICAVSLMTPSTAFPLNVTAADNTIAVTSENVLTLGRSFIKDGVMTFSYANSGIEIHFKGSKVIADIVAGQDDGSRQNIAVFVDNNIMPEDARIIGITGSGEYTLIDNLPYGEHTVTVRKMNRGYYGFLAAQTIGIRNIKLGDNGFLLSKNPEKKITIEAYGDSITNGDATYLEQDNSYSAFSWAGYIGEVARYFDADLQSCGISGNGLLRSVLADENGQYFNLFTPQHNWSKLDESATVESYSHSEHPADVVIINLGTNDNAAFTAGQITAKDFKTEYKRFMNEIHTDCPNAIIVAALGAMGADGLFNSIKEAVSESNNSWGGTYAYFTQLENCANIRGGKGYDNSHPSTVAHKIYGQQLNEIIENALISNNKIEHNEYKKINIIKATGTSTDDPYTRTADKAIDGDYSTRWASSDYDGNNEWITLELDGVYQLNKINLNWETAYAKRYNVQTSLDGINWYTDTTFNYGNGYKETKKLNGSLAKYVRINMLERGTFYSYSLYEIELFGKKMQDNPQQLHKGKNIVGEMFIPDSITPSNAGVLIDNSGMSGLEAPNHMCSSFDSNDSTSALKIPANMYSSSSKTDIIVDLGKKECLGEMFVWNYNDIRHTDNCMKQIKVSYSENGTDYRMLGTFELAQSSISDNNTYGGNVSCNVTNLTDIFGSAGENHSIDFNGVTGRYVKITPFSNYGGNQYGLSEIRIFRHKTEPVEDDSITIDGFTPNQPDDVSSINMFNNSGFSNIYSILQDNETVSNNKDDMAILYGTGDDSTIIMNLDGNYALKGMKIWNYNAPDNLDIGIKDFDIYYTVDAPCQIITHTNEQINAGQKDYIDWSKGSWKKLGSYTLSKGSGDDNMSASLSLDLTGIRAQHIKLVPKNNYNNRSNTFGLSEIKIYVDDGWATEYSREWSGMLSSSGEFTYQGNSVADSKGTSLNTTNNGRGWIGGDGLHITSLNGSQLQGSVNNDTKNIFTFQDSFEGNFGNYDGFGLTQGFAQKDNSGFSIGMRNMAYMYLTGTEPDVRNFRMYMTTKPGTYDNHPYDGFNIYPGSYWLGDSTVVNNKLYTVANMFSGLTITGADFYESPITASGFPSMSAIPNLKYSKIDDNLGVKYHETIYEEGDYLYVYGKKDNKLVCSRILAKDYPTLTGFKYWTGNGWSDNYNDAAYISDFMPGNEFNITKIQSGTFKGKYMLVHTAFSITGAVCYALSDSPTGPFVQPSDGQLYWSTEKYKLHMRYYKDSPYIFQQWNYNAKSQPSLSKDGELLITYHFGIHDDQPDRVPNYGWFQAVGKEYEHPTFIKLFDVEERKENSNAKMPVVEINGWQISTRAKGFRVVYSYSDPDNLVVERGLVYGIDKKVNENEMYIGCDNNYLYHFPATEKGKQAVRISDLFNAQTYVMTMTYIPNHFHLNANMMVRPYLKLRDGTYIYGDVESNSVFNLADYVYKNKLMSNSQLHEFLYDEILKIAQPGYQTIQY